MEDVAFRKIGIKRIESFPYLYRNMCYRVVSAVANASDYKPTDELAWISLHHIYKGCWERNVLEKSVNLRQDKQPNVL